MTPEDYVALKVLTKRQAEVYRYHRIQGRSYGTIALMLRISKESVRDHWKKAERHIRDFHLEERSAA